MIEYCVRILGDRVNTVLVREILAWPGANLGCEFPALVSYLTGRMNTPLNEPDVQGALSWLAARGLAKCDGDFIRLTQPDRSELQLYEPLSKRLTSRKFLNALDINPKTFVFQDTSTGGKLGTGLLSRPDFTLATIRAELFERALEITTIEVKNWAGATVKAVYDIRAHSRISHFPYLACPRPRFDHSKIEPIRSACKKEEIGLILFDIDEDGDGSFDVNDLKIELRPRRFSPDRAETHKYLASRLTAENCAILEALAKGA